MNDATTNLARTTIEADPNLTLFSPLEESTQPERVLDTDQDGFVYDVETGDLVDFDPLAVPGGEIVERFEIRSPEAADWVLEKMSRYDAEVLALEARKKAIVANLDRLIIRSKGRRERLNSRFGQGLEAQARRDLEGSELKSATYPHGTVSFRKSNGSVEITDAGAATQFALEWKPEAVKYSIGVTGLVAAIKAYRELNEEDADVGAFAKIHGPSEKVSIKTGVTGPGKDSD